MDCIPDETVWTVEEYNQFKRDMLTGVKEVQYADKRVVNHGVTDKLSLLRLIQASIYGHCPGFGPLGRRITVTSSKGIC